MSNITVAVTTPDPLIVTLNLAQMNIGRYIYTIIFILGNIGSILNISILTQRVYLQNSCSCYILASSTMNLIIINIPVLFRILSLGFSIDPTTTSVFFCKFRIYIAHVTTLLSRFYIVLACVDRWAMSSTSAKRRAFSQKKVANIFIPVIGIGMCIISVHILLYNDIIQNRCTITAIIYLAFYNIYSTFLSGFLIPTLMIIFGFLTIRNVKQSRQRVNAQITITQLPINQQTGRLNTRSREDEISIMILVQLCVYLVTCLPFPIYLVYSTATMYEKKASVQISIENLASTIVNGLLYINFSSTFYIYILTTRIFRKELKVVIRKNYLFKRVFGIQPDRTTSRADNENPIRTLAMEMK